MIRKEQMDELHAIPALEAIDFQANSKFGDELRAIIQNVFDFVTSYNSDMAIDDKQGTANAAEAKLKHAAVKSFLLKTTQQDIKTTIKKYTNLSVSGLVAELPTTTSNVGSIYCWFTNPSDSLTRLVYAAEGHDVDISSSSSGIHDELSVAMSMNRATGKIMKSIASYEVFIGLPVSLFVYSDFLPANMVKHQLDSGQITAVLMHEVGHVFAFMESAVTMGYSHRYGNNLLKSSIREARDNPKDTIKLLKKSDFKKATKLMSKSGIPIDKVVDRLSEADEAGYSGNWVFKMTIKILLSFVTASLVNPVVAIFPFVASGVDTFKSSNSASRTSGSFKSNKSNLTMYERTADEYVSRYGYSRQLNEAIIKLDAVFTYLSAIGEHPVRFSQVARNSWTLQLFMVSLQSSTIIIMFQVALLLGRFSPYEELEVRLRRNIQNLRDGLSDSAVPDSTKSSFIRDIDKMEADLKKMKMGPIRNISLVFRFALNLFPKIVSGGIHRVFMSGDITSTYNKYLSRIDDVLSNKGGETAARIRDLINK